MRTFKTLLLLLVAALAIAFVNATEPIPATASAGVIAGATKSRRFLRVQHDGVDDHDHEVASEAGIPGYVQAPASAPATVSAPVASGGPASVSAPAPQPVPAPQPAPAPVSQSQLSPTPGSSTTNVNVVPSTVHTNVIVTPGTSTTTVNGAAPAPQTIPQPQPQPRPAPAPAPVAKPAKPSTSGLGFDSLNPMTSVATLAHQAHGMLLGHTGTTPSAYMKGQSGGGGHGH